MTRVLPGGTIGILGGGQLARMLALEARRMDYRVAVLDPEPKGPAAQIADVHVAGALDDVNTAENLARHSDVLTLDTEHVPAEILERLEAAKPVRPAARILRIVQDRLEQRRFLDAQGAPQVRYAAVTDVESLRAAGAFLGFPAVLKTRRSGYDGKGQARVTGERDLADAWEALGGAASILESFVDFEKEISVLLARDLDGNVRFHPIAENVHRRHILRTSRVPAQITAEIASGAEALGARIASSLGHVGMMAIELFVTRQGGLLVNEIAPRTHNSGHYSLGACATSQFEQHIRAICGMPLGDPSLLRPAVMLNILGDLWCNGSPDWTAVLSQPNAHLHLYGKRRASPGRKMGHVLILGDDVEHASAVAETVAAALERGVSTSGAHRSDALGGESGGSDARRRARVHHGEERGLNDSATDETGDVERAANVLRAGGLVAFPTETVYGLGANAENAAAVARIFDVKGRPRSHPLIIHIGASNQLHDWAEGVSPAAQRLAKHFWPGPLTLVLRRSQRVPLVATGGVETVALRVPAHAMALALLSAFGGAIAAPSANRFGSVSPTSAAHVREELGTEVDFVLDGGSCEVGIESTIVDVSGDEPAILRPGGVAREELEQVLGRSISVGAKSPLPAPGQHALHYAPRPDVVLVELEELLAEAERLTEQGRRVGVLLPRVLADASVTARAMVVVPDSMTEYAQQLYGMLRELDRRGCDVIVTSLPAEERLGLAISDRLRRAAGPQPRRKAIQ